jgi:hypothetical protein
VAKCAQIDQQAIGDKQVVQRLIVQGAIGVMGYGNLSAAVRVREQSPRLRRASAGSAKASATVTVAGRAALSWVIVRYLELRRSVFPLKVRPSTRMEAGRLARKGRTWPPRSPCRH